MIRKLFVVVLATGALTTLAAAQENAAPATPKSPAEGYTIHVLAPHVVNGKVMGPFHHYCKVISPEPQIVCLIYNNTEPNSMLTQVEYIMAKNLTRANVSLADWNKYWHDHTMEIATGRVQVLDLPPDKAKQVADIVSTTDGIIYNFDFTGKLPNGHVTMAQSVGHKPMAFGDYEKSKQQPAAPAKSEK